MRLAHDRQSGFSAGSSGTDALSDVLRMVRLTGALFFTVDASSPWAIEMPDARALAPAILPRTQHVISYHVATRGSGWGGLTGGQPHPVAAGDVLVFPHGDPYVMSIASEPGACPTREEVLGFMRGMAAGDLPFAITEGGGGAGQLHLICGFLGCDVRPFNPLLSALPRVVHVRGGAQPRADALTLLAELTIAQSRDTWPGADCVRLRLSELMFVEAVRRYLASLPPEQTGWLAGLRDATVGRALALVHERPGESWTLETLARETGVSRSVLAERFGHYVGLPPMQYLAQWRMQVAARLLADGDAKVGAVALEVGYDSEAAFSRAFKKIVGMPPARWRMEVSRFPSG